MANEFMKPLHDHFNNQEEMFLGFIEPEHDASHDIIAGEMSDNAMTSLLMVAGAKKKVKAHE